MYTNVTDVGMIQTIQNVFQERIELRTPLDFPKNMLIMTYIVNKAKVMMRTWVYFYGSQRGKA